jgi:uncharacterized protein (DUF427 family)
MSIAIRETSSNLVLAQADAGAQVLPYEGNLYFDPAVVDESLLVTTDRTYTCPMKGTCQWVDFVDPEGRRVEGVAWIYNRTNPGHEAIAGKYGFYAGTKGATRQDA